MHTNQSLDRTYKFIFAAMIFFAFGLTASPTLVSGYHILLFIPTIIIYKRGFRFKLSKSSWALVALIIWGLIATVASHSELIKPNKAYQELKYYAFGIFCIGTLTYYFKKAPVRHIRLLLNILLFAIVSGFFVGILRSKYGFDVVKWEYVPGKYSPRVGGYTNYMRYGYSSALMMILGFGAFLNLDKVKNYVSRNWLIVFMIFNTLAIIFSETRGAVLTLGAGVTFVLLKYRPKFGMALVALGISGVIGIATISMSGKSKGRRTLNINDGSNKKRMSQFYSAVKSIQEKPLLGLGADQFSYHVPDIKKRHDIWSQEYSGHSHNIFLEHAANYGIPGLIAFFSFLLFWFIEMIKSKTDLGWIIASYVVGFTVGGQVELLFDVINSHLIFFLYSYSQYMRNEISK